MIETIYELGRSLFTVPKTDGSFLSQARKAVDDKLIGPVCKCGCGERVPIRKSRYQPAYVIGHYRKKHKTNLTPLLQAEKEVVMKSLRLHKGNIKEACLWLGVSRATMYNKMRIYSLTRRGYDKIT